MSTSNKNRGVGGTAEDGGLSTADTVADGGVDEDQPDDGEFEPETEVSEQPRRTTRSQTKAKASGGSEGEASGGSKSATEIAPEDDEVTGRGKPSNPENYGVGGTAEDGGLSTADTVADGGAEEEEEDSTYKPS